MQYAVPIYLSEHLLFTRNLGTVVWKPWPLVPPHPPLTTVTFYQWLSVITERCKEARVPEVLGKTDGTEGRTECLGGHRPQGLHPVTTVLGRHGVEKRGVAWTSQPGGTNPSRSSCLPVKGQGARTLPCHLVARHFCRKDTCLLLYLLGVPG